MIFIVVAGMAGIAAGFAAGRLWPRVDAGAGDALLREKNAALSARVESLEEFLARVQAEAKQSAGEAATLAAEKAALTARIAQHAEEMNAAQEQARAQFENLAAKIFESNSAKFSEQSQKSLGEMLAPLKERFGEFQKKVDESFGTQAKEQFALKEEIKRIVDVNQKMTLQTESLTKALKGDVRAQGNWGEIMLERILEESGLRKGVDYVLQSAGMGLKSAEDGSIQKPDVVVNLPEGKHVVIDSKVSLTHYERYCAEGEEVARALHQRQFTDSLRAHVNGLAARRYQDNEKLGTPDFVLMFMPVEGAYSLAVQQDAALHSFAWDRKVVLVCPTTLFATLQTIASMWKIELRNQRAQDIAQAGGRLYDKLCGFVSDMQDIDKFLGKARDSYDSALKKLAEGNGNLLRQAEQMKKMGAKTSKSLPKELLEAAEDGAESNLQELEAAAS